MKITWILLLLTLLPGWADAAEKENMSRARATFKPIPVHPPAIKGNKATKAKVDLGMKLFFDPRLSTSQLISCNTCHNVGLGGADLQETSVGHGWQKGPRNAPTVFNAVYNVAQFWDGRAKDLQTQAKGPVQASVEMNSNPELVVRTLKNIPGYPPLFEAAFPGSRDPVTFDNMAKAIEVFEATLVTPNAPFDRFLNGETGALNTREQAGLRIFIDKGCAACHGGINVGGAGYYPFGVREVPTAEVRPEADTGRFKVTNTASDKYVFRAPSLRNVAITQPFFHSGKVWSLRDAVVVMGSAQLGTTLNETEVNDTVAFLKSLTGKQPKVGYPLLPPSSDQTPHPQLK
ncbi:cytochrome C biogenesis protein CcsA [Geoanaerobacter pelophilus]|uniref:Cytochrome C biogenesis protein CcsA n=1 Tax=Geoanaerobacter pelophilus TaxID=60036 RepID=A0ABQ0MMK7_9BACT|nr:cytochrome-c peroxidase [Geoanaerobacter pelophilus]GAW68305.1 cytochrome C biogenesis protein CcsA [Geoanaerobacter pelophilus]